MEYLQRIGSAGATMMAGLRLTLKHLFEVRQRRKPLSIEDPRYFDTKEGTVTLQYPFESFPVPDNGRYRLHNEIDDCIVCDKCAKVCPVDCIDIEPIRAVEDMGTTSDGTPKRIHAAKFDIDMAKCCFCGLCTTVCPTECLTMTKVYDFSEFDVEAHNYAFATMTPLEILEKKQALEHHQQSKQMAQTKTAAGSGTGTNKPKVKVPASAKPKFVPKPRPPKKPDTDS